MDIVILKTSGTTLADAAEYFTLVSRQRQSSILKKRSADDKLNALLSELLLLSEISKRTGIAANRISFERGSFGKPYLKCKGQRPVEFSLSHTSGAICAAFSCDGEIGCDIERRDRKISRRLVERSLSDEERQLCACGEDFLRFWVQKEAFLKRLGVGITRELRGVNTPALPDTRAIAYGEYFLGISGAGALSAEITEISAETLLSGFAQAHK